DPRVQRTGAPALASGSPPQHHARASALCRTLGDAAPPQPAEVAPGHAGLIAATLFRQGDQLYEKDPHGEITEVEAESANSFFYPNGGVWTRLTVERDPEGHVTGLVFRDDRHEERWERKRPILARKEPAP